MESVAVRKGAWWSLWKVWNSGISCELPSCQVANPGEAVAKFQCNISRTISRLKVQRTEKSSLAFSCTSSHKQGKINCGASSEPDFIQNYFLWKHVFNFFDNRDKCRTKTLLSVLFNIFWPNDAKICVTLLKNKSKEPQWWKKRMTLWKQIELIIFPANKINI